MDGRERFPFSAPVIRSPGAGFAARGEAATLKRMTGSKVWGSAAPDLRRSGRFCENLTIG
jgi:hypothetical protein